MIEQYRGYEIRVFWSNMEQGYAFCVFDKDGTGILESNVYHYEEYARLEARETVDRFIEISERGNMINGLFNIYNSSYDDNNFIMWISLSLQRVYTFHPLDS